MRLREIMTLTQAQLYSPGTDLDGEVQFGCAADLMSDVLYYNVIQGLLITGLINPQVVRTAEMADMTAILMVRSKKPLPETVALAQRVGIPIVGTPLTMFETCGRLHAAGLSAACPHNGLARGKITLQEP